MRDKMRHPSRLLTLDGAILSFYLNVEPHNQKIKKISPLYRCMGRSFMATTLQAGLNVMLPYGKNINRVKLRYGRMSVHWTTTVIRKPCFRKKQRRISDYKYALIWLIRLPLTPWHICKIIAWNLVPRRHADDFNDWLWSEYSPLCIYSVYFFGAPRLTNE